MAITIRGKSVCFICGKILEEDQEVVGFPPFVINETDVLYKFNDSTCHKICFQEHPLSRKVTERLNLRQNKINPNTRICVVCGKDIDHPDNYFLIDYLIDDSKHPMYPYNYTQIHRSCLPLWKDLPKVTKLMKQLKASKDWKGKAIDYLIANLEKAVQK